MLLLAPTQPTSNKRSSHHTPVRKDHVASRPTKRKTQYTIRPVSMQKMLGLTHKKLELLKFYVLHASPLLVHASGKKDAPWMKSSIQLAKKSPALTAACLTFSQMMLYNLQNEYRYMLKGNVPHSKRLELPKCHKVVGYVPLSDKQEENLLIMFTDALAKLKLELINLDTTHNYNCVLIACVMVSMCSKALFIIPLLSFDNSGADIFGILRIIHDIQTLYLGQGKSDTIAAAPLPSKHYLPRDDLLWNIPNLVPNSDPKLKTCLVREIHTMTELYSMDLDGRSSAHLTAWSVYWHPDFLAYIRQNNPYALLLVCFYCAYVHRYHGLCWWKDRLQYDLQDILDQLPQELHQYVWWPMLEVSSFEYDHSVELGLAV
ncbi:hypothetical protein B0I72DRAFT_138962 [Yarrowia lipolytica]|uniref:YALI0C13794p n=2 Tax=Yarrowia lipolytica TaxID=4952 RepID=Q6CC07_YARLI|nr:YALI0C13794p [Yarrowia lipolytica CLIB122]RDW25623.1 hypothetical protein B0I71DRAFT_132270 [Yarrowia lipolytica]RDW31906.1 hypothetical protein B0I72DRAFT_138962 [Yarrowia lipolytica]CAG82115.1 YALI0C13794p [Yarrowia lipolytica CLIB122]|eukprot:XP_501805.1 YALI0C13794p [Yarrowia lipolytica CLIB122]